jgi:diadenosine tetraphosphate (Ap4A) HIT family hydrolase
MTTIFTRIIEGQIPGTFIYRDSLCVAFLSINPLADGHVLVVPIEEVDHWIDTSPELSAHMFSVSHRISLAISNAFPCTRVGLIIAGYEINHCHIHLIPTNTMSEMNFANAAANVERSVLEAQAEKLISELARI